MAVISVVATAAVSFIFSGERRERITCLARPEFGEISAEYEISAVYEGKTEDVTITVNERKFTFEEAEELFEKAEEELELGLSKLNGDMNKISEDLKLPEYALDGMLEVKWYSDNTDYIENNGELTSKAYKDLPAEGLVVIMYAKVELQDYSAYFEFPVYLHGDNIMSKRSIKEMIEEKLTVAEIKEPYNEMVELPNMLEGKSITYYFENDNTWWKYPLLVISIWALYLFFKSHRETKEKEKRIRQLELSYAPIITKFTLLVGAGSSIKGAWERLAGDYRAEDGVNAAYEEIQRVYNEMKNGMSEHIAYETFGKRCRLSSYIRFGNLLEQNLRKGTKGLSERLSEEVREAFESRKALAVKLGEEAGTKLLVPMVMLLLVVIIICVMPAFLSM